MESVVTISTIHEKVDMNKEITCTEKSLDDKILGSVLNQITTGANEKNNNGATNVMTSSVASILDDTTPSDSGVQFMDSESSELNESMISSTGLEFDNCCNSADAKPIVDVDETTETINNPSVLPDLVLGAKVADDEIISADANDDKIPDALISSTCSTFDTENIVYRRRIKKTSKSNTTQKKRVSFHEDILNNTKTDNIHIEHGFVTYKNCNKNVKNKNNGRYSWCSEYDVENNANQFHRANNSNRDNDHYVYRNACSDVLDYNKIDVFNNDKMVQYDNSGVFEYCEYGSKLENDNNNFYKCNCSSSNSSLESDSSDNVTNNNNSNDIKKNYQQSKSNSCDCIGTNNTINNNSGNVGMTENCYYSEPNIDYLEQKNKKSVWSKEKKPKSSCLKKSSKINNTQIIVNECDLKKNKLKKFNVHHLSDVHNIIDNSKIIIGSLKDIFSINLTERGVPEGSEDLHTVAECIPSDNITAVGKPKSFLSKSLDGNDNSKANKNKNFIHNVDEQLRRQNDEDLYAPSRKNSIKNLTEEDEASQANKNYRNKFIINCESIVYEHTGVSYCYDGNNTEEMCNNPIELSMNPSLPNAAIEEPSNACVEAQPPKSNSVKQKLSNIFRTITDMGNEKVEKVPVIAKPEVEQQSTCNIKISPTAEEKVVLESSLTSSILSDSTTSASLSSMSNNEKKMEMTVNKNRNLLKMNTAESADTSPSSRTKNRHLASPLRRKTLTTTSSNRFDRGNISSNSNHNMTPDLFNNDLSAHKINNFLTDEFDDILTITTSDTTDDKINDDMVIIDYPLNYNMENKTEYLKPPSMTSSTTSKTSLINRFLRNVTQKKILEATIKKNNFFQSKLKNEKKICTNLYVKGVKGPRNKNLIEDLNAEIAMEMELSMGQQNNIVANTPSTFCQSQQFEGNGIGEISPDIFNGNCLHILRNENEILMKVFKLYTGYSKEGFMTPVLVFLTDKTLYVTDIVRNRICNKFVLPYVDLDVILIGPHGNTVLFSNSARDMQQVLLAGGPYPADKLVSSLELCARRGGSILPAFGELTLDHLAPLQAFVRDNSTILKDDSWKYYAVVNVPANSLSSNDMEPLGPNLKGPLMHRSLSHSGDIHMWSAGYFLLKAGVLYLFNDAAHKLPTWAVALAECQGVRRSLNTGRPHCFELLLRTGALQLAAPDEYVASEWLQALIQAASGLFELQERHKTLGCTLIMTSNHLITLREDFSEPLRRISKNEETGSTILSPTKDNSSIDASIFSRKLSNATFLDSCSDISSMISASSTQSKLGHSNVSTPSRAGGSGLRITSSYIEEKSFTNMSSFYGKNSGIEILTCASIEEMIGIRIPSESNQWWCILEFSCQEVRESSDDLVVFFSTGSEFQRFLSTLEMLWLSKSMDPFPISLITTNSKEQISEHCSTLFTDINKSWEPLLTAALGYPQ